MNKRISIIVALSTAGAIVIIALGWLLCARLTDAPATGAPSLNSASAPSAVSNSPSTPSTTPLATTTKQEIPERGPDEEMMNVYWLMKINELRVQKELEPIVFDSRLAHTAEIWADHMGTTGVLSHDRPNGDKVSEWIKAYNLPFLVRAPGSGYRNTFTENIGRAYADTSMKSLQEGLDQVLTSMVEEGPDGDHYKTIFSPNWNRYGGGFYFESIATGRVRVYMTFHYASLQ